MSRTSSEDRFEDSNEYYLISSSKMESSARHALRLALGLRQASRPLHTSAVRQSHIGSLPIPIPHSVTVTLPSSSISPSLPLASPSAQRFITISGPLGSQTVPVTPPIILSNPSASASSSTQPTLSLTIHDATNKKQRSLWGLTRSLIHNAIKGVSEGYSLELRLVGVGYRAAVEPIPPVFLALQAQMPRVARPAKPGAPPYVLPPLPKDRLNLKLGYAHPVLVDIPAGITVETPQPTKVVLKGTDKQKLGLFAAKIRRWRKPEPYRGKVSIITAIARRCERCEEALAD